MVKPFQKVKYVAKFHQLKFPKLALIENKSIMIRHLVLLFAVGFVFATACTKDEAAPPDNGKNQNNKSAKNICDSIKPSFKNTIQPIFNANCATSGCHDKQSQADGRIYKTFKQIQEGVNNEPVLCAIKNKSGCLPMPRGGSPLPDSTIQKIECWQKNGAPNN